MKLLKDSLYLSKAQQRKIFLALSILTIILYIIAMIFSLCGSKYFILDYQNSQMDNIEAWSKTYHIYPLLMLLFNTIEFSIILAFILNKSPRILYVLVYFGIRAILSIPFEFPPVLDYIYPVIFYLSIPLVDQLIENKKINWIIYVKNILDIIIAMLISLGLQLCIFVIKTGLFSLENHIMNLSATFIYALEYDIALFVILSTVSLYINREKGDSICTTSQVHGGSSQTSMKQLQKSKLKNLTKNQRIKLKLLYIKVFLTQTLGFLLLMVLPFVMGKVFEFLMMYFAFAIARYILGFKYSLHYKKESICITVGIIIFGILTLAVPFFTVDVILALVLGISLAILLHLSYKYKGMYLFNKIAKPDKFAELYVLMDGDLTEHHVRIMCKHNNLNEEQTNIICDFAEGNKKSYLAKKYNYSEKSIERKINEAIDILNKNS